VIAMVSGFDPAPVLIVFFAGMFSAAALLAVAICAHLDSLRRTVDLTHLAFLFRLARVMSSVMMLWLATGVLGNGLYHRMTAAMLDDPAARAWEVVGYASTVLVGTFYSAVMVAVIIPVQLVLRRFARMSVPSSARVSEKSAREWLAVHGLDVTSREELRGWLVIVAPLVTGILQRFLDP